MLSVYVSRVQYIVWEMSYVLSYFSREWVLLCEIVFWDLICMNIIVAVVVYVYVFELKHTRIKNKKSRSCEYASYNHVVQYIWSLFLNKTEFLLLFRLFYYFCFQFVHFFFIFPLFSSCSLLSIFLNRFCCLIF